MKRLLPWIGLAASLLCGVFFLLAIAPHWRSISAIRLDSREWLSIALALAVYMAAYFTAVLGWQVSLRMLGLSIDYYKLARVFFVSQFAKFIPGNIGHQVGRVVMAKRIGIGMESAVASIVLDTIILLTAAFLFSAPAFPLMLAVFQKHAGERVWLAAGAGVVLAAWLLVLLFVPQLRHWMIRQAKFASTLLRKRNLSLLTYGVFCHSFAYLLGAIALYLVCGSVSGIHANWLTVLGVYASAWVLGFLLPGAPAGMGIREVALLVGLSPIFGEQSAIVSAALLRFVTTLGDGIVFLFGLAWWHRATRG